MKIHKASPDDAAKISRIHAQSWKGGYCGIIPRDYLDTLQENFLKNAFTLCLKIKRWTHFRFLMLAIRSGCVSYGKSRDESLLDFGGIVSVCLIPEQFRKGDGRALLERALPDL